MEPFLERAHRRAQTGAWLWRIGAVVAIIAAVFCLGACTLVPANPDDSAVTVPNGVGTCLNSLDPDILSGSTWVDGVVHSCSDTHNVITVATVQVPTLAKNASATLVDIGANPGAPFGNSDFSAAARRLCAAEVRTELPAMMLRPQRLHSLVGLPNAVEWAAGSRWARCDITALHPGSPWNKLTFAPLPATIEELRRDSDDPVGFYDFCLNPVGDPGPAGPGDAIEMTISACDDHPRWKLVSTESLSTMSRPDGVIVFMDEDEALAVCTASAERSGLHPGTFRISATLSLGGKPGSSAFCWADLGIT
jgi:hypothetical protein